MLNDFGFKNVVNYFLNHLRMNSIEDSLNSYANAYPRGII
jgi:hypothetical protein